jgi:hypothetical protein
MLQPLIAGLAVLLLFGAAVYAQGSFPPGPPRGDMDMQEDGPPPSPPGPRQCWIEDRPDGPHRVCEDNDL